MKTNTRPAPSQPKPTAPPQPRQLSIAFDTQMLLGLAGDKRATAVRALTTMLLQAAGAHRSEDDDVEQ